MVRHISRGIAEGVSAAVAEDDRRPRRLHGDQHRGHGHVRQIHHHPESIHLQHDTLRTSPVRGGIIGPSFATIFSPLFLSPSIRDNVECFALKLDFQRYFARVKIDRAISRIYRLLSNRKARINEALNARSG